MKLLVRLTIFLPFNAMPDANSNIETLSNGVNQAAEPLFASNKMSETAPIAAKKTIPKS
ncbi:hypothetical protein [Rhizobium skierniewicense]|uniref:hypothetical protein n=1 Tax=Rhizobium skierniewicense TaxID=984260 RepID=UPI00157306A0|nr:hypothetical protein [Rhizobium skierniewicense]NTF34640.1 hypothetical protein [Rhizobium skierniewicense]